MWAYVMFYTIYFETMMSFLFFEFTYKFCIHVIKKKSLFQESTMIFNFFPKNLFLFSIRLKSIVTWIIKKMAMLMLNMNFIYSS